MKLKTAAATLIPVLVLVAGPVVADEPKSDRKEGVKEVFEYTMTTKDGKRVSLGKTEVTYSPDRKTFDREVDKARRAKGSLLGQKSRKFVRDTYPDGRAPTTRTVHPNDRAAELDREEADLEREDER